MLRIRQITDAKAASDRRELQRVQEILRTRLPGLSAEEIASLPDRLRDPVAHELQAMLFVAEDLRGRLQGFALLSHAPDLGFCLLDYLASTRGVGGGGIGGALYEHVQQVARDLGAVGIFLECLPDDPTACSDPASAKQNASRLRFYERHGARPIVGTGYETPLKPGDLDLPHLVFDDLGTGRPLPRERARAVVRAILERKYAQICSPGYIDSVVTSFADDPVRLRAPRYTARKTPPASPPPGVRIALVVNEAHDIHHVRERGYVEAPVRVRSLLAGLEPTGMFDRVEPRAFGDEHLTRVHTPELVAFLERTSALATPGKPVYPYVFPVRNRVRVPEDPTYAAGYYCIDTFTPLDANAYKAARAAVDCTLTAAQCVLDGAPLAYALVRPPGHHAERAVFGGFCYFNNAAIAAEHLARSGAEGGAKVAILDVDYHHGNGQQDVFYARGDVLTVSIHGHPRFAYPFFTGFADEIGEGEGVGCNHNFPLDEDVDGERYRQTLEDALGVVRAFDPDFLVVALGLDTAKRDPTGTWQLDRADFAANGERIGGLRLPTLVVQEGGYRTTSLGANARAFFVGLAWGHHGIERKTR
jgi:acetoin utilization deacetylase AcuC-like enzyme/GNAT superfamily N-acetyltransferase